MPPYIEADSHQDNDWAEQSANTSSQTKQSPLLTHDVPNRDRLDSTDSVPSPLFRDSKSLRTTPTSGGLDRRMSDPDGLATTSLKDDPLAVTVSPPVVSRITAIIGPESAYVKKPTPSGSATTSSSSGSSSSSTSVASKTATPKATAAAAANTTKAQPFKKSKIIQPPSSSQTTTTPTNNKNNKSQQLQNKKSTTTKPLHIQVRHCIRKKGWKVAFTKSLPRKLASSMTISISPTNFQTGGGATKKASTSPNAAADSSNRNVI